MSAWTFEAIGTAWQIDTPDELAEDVQAAVLAAIERFDRAWSRFRADSVVSELAQRAGTHTLDGAEVILDFYDGLFDATDGAVTPMIGQALSDLGYDATYSLRPQATVTAVPHWPSSVNWSADQVTTTEPVLIDIGAAGKGMLVDRVAALLAETGLSDVTVDASGDLRHDGTEPIRVALEHPLHAGRAIGVVELNQGDALCGSATNRRTWGDGLHHVIDGRTGRPTDSVIATWVLAPQSCMTADGLATAHFFAEPEPLFDRWDHQFVRVHADGRVVWSTNFQGEIFQ